MYEEKDHLCTGATCIFCRIFSVGNPGTSQQSIIAGQNLSRMKEISSPDRSPLKHIRTDQVDRLEVIEKLAFYDQLTGICNSHAFMRELQEEVARSQRYKRPLSICMLKVDDLVEIKRLNGPLGAEMVLKHVAGVLKESLRGVDMAAYYQGDTFGLILPETNNAGAIVVAERIIKRLASKPVKLNLKSINISVSIGVATFLKHGQSRDEMIRAALGAITGVAN